MDTTTRRSERAAQTGDPAAAMAFLSAAERRGALFEIGLADERMAVDAIMFRSLSGRRFIDGEEFHGPCFVLGTTTVAETQARVCKCKTCSPADPSHKIIRKFSPAGPCFLLGRFERETKAFIVYHPFEGTREHATGAKLTRVNKNQTGLHVGPCRRCTDHPQTTYPNGYQD